MFFQIVQVNFLDLNCSFKLPWLSPSVKNRIWRIVNTQLWQLARHLEHAIHHNTARLLQSYILMSFYLWDFKLLNSCLCIITCSWILMLNRSRNFTVILKLRVPNDELIFIIRYWQVFKCVFYARRHPRQFKRTDLIKVVSLDNLKKWLMAFKKESKNYKFSFVKIK